MTPDNELLGQYAEHGSQAAFTELVQRHVNMVYSVALRLMGNDCHLAEDMAQTVFTTLALRARSLVRHPTLVGWLHTTAHFAATNAIRTQQRRRAREHAVFTMSQNPTTPEISWEQLRPVLDDAINQLKQHDRIVVLLRFFQNKNHREVAEILGLSEAAARKRGDRALEKLRRHFAQRGIVATGALLGETILANAAEAEPVGLAGRVSNAATSAPSAAALGWGALALRIMFTNAKMTILPALLLIPVATLLTFQIPRWFASALPDKSAISGMEKSAAPVPTSREHSVPMPGAMPIQAPSDTEAMFFPIINVPVLAGDGPPPPPSPPRVVGLFGAGARADGSNAFDSFSLQMKFTAEQKDEFLKILDDREGQIAALRATARSTLGDERLKNILSEVRAEIIPDFRGDAWERQHQRQSLLDERLGISGQVKAIRDASDVKLRRLLGSDENFDAYQLYRSQVGIRSWVDLGYGPALRRAGADALMPVQEDALLAIIANSIQPGDSSMGLGHIDEVMAQASGVLSPQQLEVLRTNPWGPSISLSYARLHSTE